ncbi:MAG: hypothetical protein LBI78_01095 [Campylobacteraceae bacterium]|jgi:hypothetical protein|nr:hypothetical protein [Campylobacteraceae bacterium]
MFKKIFATAIVVFLLTGCGSDNASDKTSKGELPKLDRSSDIAGPDENQNGIRDDIEAYIVENYPDEKHKKALFQYAKVKQASLLVDAADRLAAKKIGTQNSRALHCIFLRFDTKKGTENPDIVSDKIFSMTTNTKARLKAYLAYNKALDGTAWTLPEGDTCE